MARKEWLEFSQETGEMLLALTNAQAGRVFKAALHYVNTGTVPQLDPDLQRVFDAIKHDTDSGNAER